MRLREFGIKDSKRSERKRRTEALSSLFDARASKQNKLAFDSSLLRRSRRSGWKDSNLLSRAFGSSLSSLLLLMRAFDSLLRFGRASAPNRRSTDAKEPMRIGSNNIGRATPNWLRWLRVGSVLRLLRGAKRRTERAVGYFFFFWNLLLESLIVGNQRFPNNSKLADERQSSIPNPNQITFFELFFEPNCASANCELRTALARTANFSSNRTALARTDPIRFGSSVRLRNRRSEEPMRRVWSYLGIFDSQQSSFGVWNL
uniref:Uncharacterized protein n=1 Tax=Pediastrum angulosum TaxID=271408 RepID=A0A2U8GHI1_9CHLO|nr:hypothetical protein [Pediastrum angulosum]YP_009492028.1 hypothetical protein [Pediastrum angulosum]AWI68132.1 hypothetical protein [Pediastrum angulosum]AWI68133.1 hypothetical protein [Pediastrum angulosum]